MKRMQFCALFLFGLLNVLYPQNPSSLNSQNILYRLKQSSGFQKQVKITLDPGIEENFQKHLAYNKKNPDFLGLRIRIYRGSGTGALDEATRVRANFASKYDDVNAYLKFDTPDFVVYVGDCRTWSEVLKLFYRIEKDYPFSYVVPQQPVTIKYNQEYKPDQDE